MLAQVIAPHEALVTHGTRKAFFTSMGAEMPRQFVGTGEPFAAPFPAAGVRALPRVGPDVRLQVGAFPVSLTAPRKGAYVRSLLLLSWRRLRSRRLGDKARIRAGRELGSAAHTVSFRWSLGGSGNRFGWLSGGVQ